VRYLKQGKLLGWCDYDPKEILRNVGRNNNAKQIVQLTKDGMYIKNWDTIADAVRELGIYPSGVSEVCSGKHKTAGCFMWMYQEDFERMLNSVE
jgi:hypothetical protein